MYFQILFLYKLLQNIDPLTNWWLRQYSTGNHIVPVRRTLGEGNGYPLQYFCLLNSMQRSLAG